MRSNEIPNLEKISGKDEGHPRASKNQVSFAVKNQG